SGYRSRYADTERQDRKPNEHLASGHGLDLLHLVRPLACHLTTRSRPATRRREHAYNWPTESPTVLVLLSTTRRSSSIRAGGPTRDERREEGRTEVGRRLDVLRVAAEARGGEVVARRREVGHHAPALPEDEVLAVRGHAPLCVVVHHRDDREAVAHHGVELR